MTHLEVLNIAIDCLVKQISERKVSLEKVETKLNILINERDDINRNKISIHSKKVL